ncbi:hypothetical protein KY290_036801 [Solanum tuberosum]|uniref:Uncharacterized protein n=1 Tax=Solanum tuberosum TaxID=4113 RepID=A0ABQ7TU69_SOLTU|nr:hypothetical protein KY290_036801 [Solanum tuberosum]
MEDCKLMNTPMNQKEKLMKDDGSDKVDEVGYKSMVGCLMSLPRDPTFCKQFGKSQNFKLQGYSNSDWTGSDDDI